MPAGRPLHTRTSSTCSCNQSSNCSPRCTTSRVNSSSIRMQLCFLREIQFIVGLMGNAKKSTNKPDRALAAICCSVNFWQTSGIQMKWLSRISMPHLRRTLMGRLEEWQPLRHLASCTDSAHPSAGIVHVSQTKSNHTTRISLSTSSRFAARETMSSSQGLFSMKMCRVRMSIG